MSQQTQPSSENLQAVLRTTSSYISRLRELGIETVEDFLKYFPRRYTDKRNVIPILEVTPNEHVVVRGKVVSLNVERNQWRRMATLHAMIADSSGSILARWYNQLYLERIMQKGSEVILSGKVTYDPKKAAFVLQNPEVEPVREKQIHSTRIVPLYHETDLRGPQRSLRISSKWIREKIYPLLPLADGFEEFLPSEIRHTYGLIEYSAAIRNIHFPPSEIVLDQARRRLSFDELFLLQLTALQKKMQWRTNSAHKIPADWELLKAFLQSLPWKLTNCQKKSIYQIVRDLNQDHPMSRLLEGDVGSGKTVVAAAAGFLCIRAGFQVCIMAPTEILAAQHYKTIEKLVRPFAIQPELLTGSTQKRVKKDIRERLKEGSLNFIIGTHALIQEGIAFKNLALAIIDEQHRFGVHQREIMKSFGTPHLLHLTATPIPRSLALVLYGEQDLSVLDEMPPGRQKIISRIVSEKKRRDAYAWIQKKTKEGRQAFVICPLVNESELIQVKAATDEFERLSREVFPSLKLGLLHGQMDAHEKHVTMELFATGKIDILVTTAVVEVGIDVANATIMIIEGAERFGLSQLHQFRGRVGRGVHQSYCLLFPTHLTKESIKRMGAFVRYDSGFKLSEIDLKLRGPGEIYGVAQSGIPDLKMATLSDFKTIQEAREAAQSIIERDPKLELYPVLRKKIAINANVAIDW